jgi:hybrid cluster-associated redox disulfide protein
MNDRIPKPYHTVNEVMRRWPQTMWLFMHYGMACAGCPVGAFHTVEEAALEYRIPLRTFLSELRNAVTEGYKRPLAKRKSPAAEGRRSVRP